MLPNCSASRGRRRLALIRLIFCTAVILAAVEEGLLGTGSGSAAAGPTLADVVRYPVPLRDAIGRCRESVTTSSDPARAFYNQGLVYLHSFVWIEAARSFNEALRIDRNLAMAYLGLSYALGELGMSEDARAAARQANTLAAAATERERLRIEIRVKQLEATAHPERPSVQADYRTQLDQALMKYPADVELLLLVGQAQDPTRDAHGMGAGSRSLRFYEEALAQSPDYFATHHYLTHAYENINRMDSALAYAERYVRAADAVPHAHHMFGHVLRRVDRMREAIAEFVKADALEVAYLKEEGIPPPYDWHYRHNLDVLGMSYQYVGQMKSAEPVLRRSFEVAPVDHSMQDLSKTEWPTFLLARGRADEALAAANFMTTHPVPLVQAIGHLMAGRALLILRRTEAAAERGNTALTLMRTMGPVGGVLLPEFQLVQGEFLLRTGRAVDGRYMLREAASKLRAQSGPDAWIQTLFSLEAVARAAREVGDWTLAGEFTDQMRLHDGTYPGTSYALAVLAQHKGDRAAARAHFTDVVRRWADADPDLRELRDAQRALAALLNEQ